MSAKKFIRNQDVVTRTIGEETILVPVGQSLVDLSCLFTLNDTGGVIWEQLADPSTMSELVAAVEKEFDVTRDQVARDVTRFLEDLARERCIVEVGNEDEG